MRTAVAPRPANMPEPTTQLASYQGAALGQTVVVCGCGPSLNELTQPERFTTIGVNDVGRLFDPTYLVVVNPRSQFKADRFRYVEQSNAQALFTQLDLGPVRAPVVRFRLGRHGGTDTEAADVLHYTQNSPYVAVCLAALMGARRIGLIGVDLTDHHFFASTGRHSLAGRLREIDAEYGRLAAALRNRGIELVNLSSSSRLTSLPRLALSDWAVHRPSAPVAPQGLCIVSYATTPVAGVPAVLARCIAKATPHSARCVWATNGYGNGVAFTGDVQWTRQPREAMDLLEAADLVIVHNGHTAPAHQRLLASKPVITMAHNYGWNVDMQWVRRGGPGVVVGQYQATLSEFANWAAVPNPLPLWEPEHQAAPKSGTLTVAYTPSGRHETYPPGHRLYWHGKGFHTTMRVLQSLVKSHGIALETTAHSQVTHERALQMKQRAHIVIDECVTGSYHRNSLEGLATGSVVVNGVGTLPSVVDVLRRCVPLADRLPFAYATLETLETVLRELIERGPTALAEQGRANRAWMEQHWGFEAQWRDFWMPVVDAALANHKPQRAKPVLAPVPAIKSKPPATVRPLVQSLEISMQRTPAQRVSVVVPHGGRERLPQLTTMLATLRQRGGIEEVIVVEMGAQPVAQDVAARWADKHLFIEHHGAFERARALNAGAAVADGDLVLWHDNDLITPAALIANSVSELNERALDFLIPYTSVRYLREADTLAVMQGQRSPQDCEPLNIYYATRAPSCSGGLGLVRAEFLQRHGGFIEGFRGWGGEDNAWNRKVALLGRSAATRRQDHHVYHLYHLASGGHVLEAACRSNPHHSENLQLLNQVNAAHDRIQLTQQFPPTPPAQGVLTRSAGTAGSSTGDELPIWSYWEGPCPAWIRACRRTLAKHAPRVRFLNVESFDALRDRDRDIDLSRLGIPQRADYIRAFLLQRYGGLWVDADCLVMGSLQSVLDALKRHEFVAHRERSGLVSNGFIAARTGSRIAAEHYGRISTILRARKPVHWCTLGSEPLTATLTQHPGGWHELPVERVQPICWSQPAEFLVDRSPAQHDNAIDPQALCYMLSNAAMTRHIADHPGAELLRASTFFSHLLRRSLGADADEEVHASFEAIFDANVELYRQHRLESMSGPGSSVAQTQELRERLPLLIESLGIESLLDAPCGDFNWMQHVQLGGCRYIGVDVHSEIIAQNQWRHTRPGRSFQRLDLTRDALPEVQAIFSRDLLPHLSYAEIQAVLKNFYASGAKYLLTTTFTQPRPNVDTSNGEWRPLNLTLAPFNFPAPLRRFNEKCTEAGGAFNDKCVSVWELGELAERVPLRL